MKMSIPKSLTEKGCAHRADCPQLELLPLRLSSTSYLSECQFYRTEICNRWVRKPTIGIETEYNQRDGQTRPPPWVHRHRRAA